MSLLQLFDNFVARVERFRSMRQIQPQVTYFKNIEHSSKAPLFGVDPHTADFGLDWAGEPARMMKGGQVPSYVPHNTEGIHVDAQPLLPPQKSEIQESRRLNYESIPDQGPTSHRGGRTINWDGQVRVGEKPHGFELSKPKESTIGDRIGKEMRQGPRKETYWFLP